MTRTRWRVVALVAAASMLLPTTASAFDTPTVVNSFGVDGADPGQFSSPMGVAIGTSNRVFVVDQGVLPARSGGSWSRCA